MYQINLYSSCNVHEFVKAVHVLATTGPELTVTAHKLMTSEERSCYPLVQLIIPATPHCLTCSL